MPTRWRLEITQEGIPFTTDLSIIDEGLAVKWETVHQNAWGDSGGSGAWASGVVVLNHRSGRISLFEFTKRIEPGVTGKGEKQTAGSGRLKDGEFAWKCVEKT